LASDAADEPPARAPRYFPSIDEVVDANRVIHEDAGQPERFELRDQGFLVDALERARTAQDQAANEVEGIIAGAAHSADGIAHRQAFRDGNRRTARAVVQAYLTNNDMSHLSPPGADDHMLARYLNGTVTETSHPVEQYVDLFARKHQQRTPPQDAR
jgi:prophage maintenance system killer protein